MKVSNIFQQGPHRSLLGHHDVHRHRPLVNKILCQSCTQHYQTAVGETTGAKTIKGSSRHPHGMDYLNLISAFPQQLADAKKICRDIRLKQKPGAIIICGMGSSGTVGDIIHNLDCSAPLAVNKTDHLPAFVDQSTLVFLISYTGNTPEIIRCGEHAIKRKARAVAITSGGQLLRFAQQHNIPSFTLPAGHFPHWSISHLLLPVLTILANNQLINTTVEDIEIAITMLSKAQVKDRAEALAHNIGSKTPLIYAGHQLSSAAWHIKESFNRIARQQAFANVFPEISHAEIHALPRNSHIILLRDQTDSPIVEQGMNTLKEEAKAKKIDITELMLRGERPLNKILLAIFFGEHVSFYCAQRSGTLIEKTAQ
ncbi:hypothetical protein HY490_03265 [Candidatus Woesearchaeota archaeon]|nr:hypothetical protein [Candidatus Woesearchaeota archaeon]